MSLGLFVFSVSVFRSLCLSVRDECGPATANISTSGVRPSCFLIFLFEGVKKFASSFQERRLATNESNSLRVTEFHGAFGTFHLAIIWRAVSVGASSCVRLDDRYGQRNARIPRTWTVLPLCACDSVVWARRYGRISTRTLAIDTDTAFLLE